MSVVVAVADAVVDELNAGTFGQPFTAERNYLPCYELEDIKNLRVTVVPKTVAIQIKDRSSTQDDVEIDIAVQQKLTTADNAEIDPLLALVQEIADYLRFKRFSPPDAIWVGTRNEPVYAQEHLDRFRVFTSLLTLTYRVFR